MNMRSRPFLPSIPILLLLILTVCTGPIEVLAGPPPLTSSTPSATPLPFSPAIRPVATPAIPIAESPLAFAPVVTRWKTYFHPSGVSLLYPADWQVDTYELPGSYPWVTFRAPEKSPGPQAMPLIVRLSVSDLPEYRETSSTCSWPLTESLNIIWWASPICTRDAEGLFILQSDQLAMVFSPIGPFGLSAVFYSVPYQLHIQLSTSVPPEIMEEVAAKGCGRILAHFGFFETMARSVSINR